MMKRAIILVSTLLVGLLLLGSVGACVPQPTVETRQQIVGVERGDMVITVSADGNLVLPEQRDLTFATSGTIVEILIEEGDVVVEGQVLARLDTIDLERDVVTREQAVKSSELAVRNAEIDLRQFDQDSEAAIRNAEIALEKATDDFRQITYPYTYSTFTIDIPVALAAIKQAETRLGDLQAMLPDGLDDSELDTAQEKLRKALDDLVAAREKLMRGQGADIFGDTSQGAILSFASFWTLKAAEQSMEQAEVALTKLRDNAVTGREKAEVALESAQVNLETANNQLDIVLDELGKAEMRAPFDGVVVQVPARVGEMLTAANYAARTVLTLVNPGWMEIEAEVDEIDVPSVGLGQQGVITVDALPDLEMAGEVTFISLLARQDSGLVLYRIKVGFSVPEGIFLREGMTAKVDIITNERIGVLLISERAVTEDSEGNPVVKVMSGDQVEERPVTLGASDGFKTEITEGLNEGDRVIEEIRVRT
ncbi:MAG: efflux RND transporter periplasmic adaptor subunit [Dehalococcoidales bacterium]|jgi:HlyD family secretion protein